MNKHGPSDRAIKRRLKELRVQLAEEDREHRTLREYVETHLEPFVRRDTHSVFETIDEAEAKLKQSDAGREAREKAEARLALAVESIRYLFYYRLPTGEKVEDILIRDEEYRWATIYAQLTAGKDVNHDG